MATWNSGPEPIVAGVFDESPRLLGRERLHLMANSARRVHQRRDVAVHQSPLLRLPERPPQDGPDVLHGAGREASGRATVEECLDVLGRQFGQLIPAKLGDDVQPDVALVALVRAVPQLRLGGVGQPARHVLRDRLPTCAEVEASIKVAQRGPELVLRLLADADPEGSAADPRAVAAGASVGTLRQRRSKATGRQRRMDCEFCQPAGDRLPHRWRLLRL